MSKLTGQEVVSGVAKNIRAAFTTAEISAIYKDKPTQGMLKPCVFLHSVDSSHTNRLRGSADWGFIVDVRCHPADYETEVDSWARKLAVRLLPLVNKVNISGQVVKSYDLTWSVQDGVLHMIAKYSFRVRESPVYSPDMETMDYGSSIRD